MRTAWTRAIALCLALSAGALAGAPREASASVSIAVTFDALVRDASAVVVATAVEQKSVWEKGRIYTHTRIHVDQAVAGELKAGDEGWVRTLGGVVGTVGQLVEGEAVFTVGRSSLTFLRREVAGTYVVSARAQGQFGLYVDEQKAMHLQKSRDVGGLFPPKGANANLPLAADVIHGRTVSDASNDIASAWTRLHAP